MKTSLSEEESLAIRCAYADLIGAIQARHQGDAETHDWYNHRLTIDDVYAAFGKQLKLPAPKSHRDIDKFGKKLPNDVRRARLFTKLNKLLKETKQKKAK